MKFPCKKCLVYPMCKVRFEKNLNRVLPMGVISFMPLDVSYERSMESLADTCEYLHNYIFPSYTTLFDIMPSTFSFVFDCAFDFIYYWRRKNIKEYFPPKRG